MTMSKPPPESVRAKASASALEASGISRIEGATVALPPLLAISFAISGARRLSSDSTRSPAKPLLEFSFSTFTMMQHSEVFFQPEGSGVGQGDVEALTRAAVLLTFVNPPRPQWFMYSHITRLSSISERTSLRLIIKLRIGTALAFNNLRIGRGTARGR